jgi:methionyl-tRNA synthetase
MPTTANEIREQLNAQYLIYALENHFRCYLPPGHKIGQARPLFDKIEQALIDEYCLRFSGQEKNEN